jgi:hypothetical protein
MGASTTEQAIAAALSHPGLSVTQEIRAGTYASLQNMLRPAVVRRLHACAWERNFSSFNLPCRERPKMRHPSGETLNRVNSSARALRVGVRDSERFSIVPLAVLD